MTQCILVQTAPSTIAVKSDYDRGFAYTARMHGGDFKRETKLWVFEGPVFDIQNLRNLCAQFYPTAEIADALPANPVPAPAMQVVDHGHVGTVGSKLTVRVTVSKVSDFTGAYGATRCHTMTDASGHVFTWFASTARHNVGDTLTLVGTVKKHDSYKGVSQTVLTRCKKL